MTNFEVPPKPDQLRVAERLLPPGNIGICVATRYPGWYPGPTQNPTDVVKMRGDMGLLTVQAAVQQGFNMAVVDGGSSASFIEAVKNVGGNTHLVEIADQTMGTARRTAFKTIRRISDVQVITWTEAEKVPLLTRPDGSPNLAIREAATMITEGEADIVVPHRTEQGFASYPHLQAQLEKRGNATLQRLLTLYGYNVPNLDVFMGPKIFANTPEILEYFLAQYTYRPNIQKGLDKSGIINTDELDKWASTITMPVIAAVLGGYRVASLDIEYIHPPQQTQLEVGNVDFDRKRQQQLSAQVKAAIELAKLIKGNAPSQLQNE